MLTMVSRVWFQARYVHNRTSCLSEYFATKGVCLSFVLREVMVTKLRGGEEKHPRHLSASASLLWTRQPLHDESVVLEKSSAAYYFHIVR